MNILYESCERLILGGNFENMEHYLDVFYGGNKLSTEEYNKLITLLGVE